LGVDEREVVEEMEGDGGTVFDDVGERVKLGERVIEAV